MCYNKYIMNLIIYKKNQLYINTSESAVFLRYSKTNV